MNSLKHNPENLDSMLSLGVSCTNILDEVKAMNYIKNWIILNPKYKHYKVDPNIIPEKSVHEQTYRIEDIKMMNERMVNVFEEIIKNNANDP
jgi:peroxin-5